MRKKKLLPKLFAHVLLITFCIAIAVGSFIPAKAQNVTHPNLLDTAQLSSFLDSIFAEEMEKTHIPGAVVSIVKDGTILFTKGYGFANIEMKMLIIPDKTNVGTRMG